MREHFGAWWCPRCSKAYDSTMQTNHGEPCCPKCGALLEEQGTGDDATSFEEIEPKGER